MKADPKVIEYLNTQLTNELTAINQYFLHARTLRHWGVTLLGKHEYKESIEEMHHADWLIERILFLDGTPNLTELLRLNIGQNVKDQLQNDLKLELNAVTMYNNSVKLARDEGDNASRELFEKLLADEEMHVDWLEAQVHQMKELGYERYLSQQIGDSK